MEILLDLAKTLLSTIGDILPILLLLVGFQFLVLRKPLPHARHTIIGFIYVLLGLALFLSGLEKALFPIGKLMAAQLSDPMLVFGTPLVPEHPGWWNYGWIYLFAFLIGFATTIAEPSLLAVALKAQEVSRGTVEPFHLRIAVALGVAVGITLGTFRIVTGHNLVYYIVAGYLVVLVQTFYAPRMIIPLAYDSGGVTTSTVTVPLVAALGLGLSATIPGRNPLLDGFGLIAFASLFPMISVMGYAQLAAWMAKRAQKPLQDARQQDGTSR
ncbi:protein of unknown function DUF1538 [Magnetococcus marinus MC-1]|uniref:DUF1538 domain-containing protein n=1 Tax=Magnetococcus marinus (strain ATCC BAA-1437 / JCM 17883 / MC-1) TaxID=156889 RepID=A0LDX7_MAGMM|nr:DUF1538 domain-containing protein [Magnetococcus marinus]ABK46170.1 protein of unknown function DUF1538 [Magnetococcus marinus MC-1]